MLVFGGCNSFREVIFKNLEENSGFEQKLVKRYHPKKGVYHFGGGEWHYNCLAQAQLAIRGWYKWIFQHFRLAQVNLEGLIYKYSKRSMWKSLAFILHSIIFICHPFAKSSVIPEACRNHLENRRKQILFMQERLEEWGATKKPWNCAVSTYTRAIPSQHKTPVPQSPAVWNDLRWDAMDRGILSSQIARCPVFKSHCWAPKKIRPDTISYYYKVYHSNSIVSCCMIILSYSNATGIA